MITNRQESNREILKILSDAVEKYPEMRFSQILLAYKVVEMEANQMYWEDEFYLESSILLERIETRGKELV